MTLPIRFGRRIHTIVTRWIWNLFIRVGLCWKYHRRSLYRELQLNNSSGVLCPRIDHASAYWSDYRMNLRTLRLGQCDRI